MTLSPEQANATSRAHAAASLLRLGKALRLAPLTTLSDPLRQFVQGIVARRRASAHLASHDVRQLHCPPGLIEAQRDALTQLRARLGTAGVGACLEFGVGDASSLTSMYRLLRELELTHVRLFGFDPFDGPDPWDPNRRAQLEVTRGALRKRKVPLRSVVLTETRFERLDARLRDRHWLTAASVISVNCGEAASASHVLRFCEPMLQREAALFLHNGRAAAARNQGEREALDRFLRQHPDLAVRALARYGEHGEAFMIRRNLSV